MIKPSWGTKQTCPKCGERFYDLGQATPVVCIACETKWTPEPILKSKQTHVAPKKEEKPKPEATGDDVATDELSTTDDSKDGDKKEGDDAGVLGDVSLDDANTDIAGVVDAKIDKGDAK